MKVVIRGPSLPILLLGILCDVPVLRVKPKASRDPGETRQEGTEPDPSREQAGAVGRE